ncbi:MAG: hypothetical protein DYG89_22150 [Caldilinea sp. CFX5]|nr:hypothetical protein [Caldilinea sp. CFX5]
MATRSTNPSTERGPVRQPLCPYLARFDAQERQVAPVDYPSFENHCRAVEGEASLLLTDQATFCLSGSYRICDRFQLVHLEAGPSTATTPHPPRAPDLAAVETLAEEPWGQPWFPEKEAAWTYRPSRQLWAWASAAVIFAAVLLTGGGVAAYVGWELALQSGMLSRNNANASIDTLASAANGPPAPAFVVVTATSDAPPAPVVATPPPAEGAAPPSDNPQAYPEAVTATPIVLTAPDTAANPPPVENPPSAVILQPTFTETPVPPRNLVLPDPATAGTPTVFINVEQVLPTVPARRPTPLFEIPTDTPVPLAPTATPTLAILGTPVVVFGPDESAVPPGECTRVRWHVVNVREVYYENLPSLGDGSREECIDKEANTYALRVVLADGQTKIYTTTLNVLWPTPTPTFTPSFTPEPAATETWTPQPPTVTPPPNVIYAVSLGIEGERRRGCPAGADCTIGVLVTNMGDHPDTLSVEFLEKGSATARLCRQDGVCGEQKLTISNVGPNNTAFLFLRVSLPGDSAGAIFKYVLRGISDGSQGAMTSEAVTVEVESQ